MASCPTSLHVWIGPQRASSTHTRTGHRQKNKNQATRNISSLSLSLNRTKAIQLKASAPQPTPTPLMCMHSKEQAHRLFNSTIRFQRARGLPQPHTHHKTLYTDYYRLYYVFIDGTDIRLAYACIQTTCFEFNMFVKKKNLIYILV